MNTVQHAALLNRVYDNITLADRRGKEALQSVLMSLRWKGSPNNTSSSLSPTRLQGRFQEPTSETSLDEKHLGPQID